MSAVGPDSIGEWLELQWSGGGIRATGSMIGYCEQPSVAIITEKGERIHWRADMARVVPVPEADDVIERVTALADEIWRESQGDQTIIHDAGIMQDIVDRLRAALVAPDNHNKEATT